jgi:HSP20 family protein
MNFLIPKTKWIDDWFPEWNPGYMIRPLHGDAMLSQIRIDVSETDGTYEVKADIPGVTRENIDVQIENKVVSISAEIKQEDRQAKDDQYLRSERYFGRVSRSFELPSAVESEQCVAKYTNGVLSLTIPKVEPKENQRKINVS